ncbi:hypothetical protein N0A02_23605 [Paraburkholderia acidicola]|uniref:Coronafacic acid synthetase n=1 Tax=Paraburkholderia acidicola TaxID=1912599 RepID=A0ABV1LSY0_9BURK
MNVRSTLCEDIRSHNKPSLFATPLAWATSDFVQTLIDEAGEIRPSETGMIVVSDDCSLDTVRELAATAVQGKLSPLRFAGASPSIVVGLPALQQGIRGPTLALTMSPEHAVAPVIALITYWLTHSGIDAAIVVAHHRHGVRSHLFKGLVVRSIDAELGQQVMQLCNAASDEPAFPDRNE